MIDSLSSFLRELPALTTSWLAVGRLCPSTPHKAKRARVLARRNRSRREERLRFNRINEHRT